MIDELKKTIVGRIEMEIPADWLETLMRLGSAILFSSVIGFEREIRDKPESPADRPEDSPQ